MIRIAGMAYVSYVVRLPDEYSQRAHDNRLWSDQLYCQELFHLEQVHLCEGSRLDGTALVVGASPHTETTCWIRVTVPVRPVASDAAPTHVLCTQETEAVCEELCERIRRFHTTYLLDRYVAIPLPVSSHCVFVRSQWRIMNSKL